MNSSQSSFQEKGLSSFVPELLFILNECIRHDHERLGALTAHARLSCTRPNFHKIDILLLIPPPGTDPGIQSEQEDRDVIGGMRGRMDDVEAGPRLVEAN